MSATGSAPCGMSVIAREEYALGTAIDAHIRTCPNKACKKANGQLAEDFGEDEDDK